MEVRKEIQKLITIFMRHKRMHQMTTTEADYVVVIPNKC